MNAQQNGEFDNLPGMGAPLELSDDSHIQPELRAAYRLLKNAGCLPPELQLRKEAIELNDLLNSIEPGNPDYQTVSKKVMLLEVKLRQMGFSTDFLRGSYAQKLLDKVDNK